MPIVSEIRFVSVFGKETKTVEHVVKPCPHCDGEHIKYTIVGDEGYKAVYCEDCGGAVFGTTDVAITKLIETWNKRVERKVNDNH